MSKHTPGPWTFVHEGGIGGGYFIDAKEDVVVLPRGRLNEADARLIAAAPDLLGACKALVEAGGNPANLKLGSDELQRFVSAWGDMRAAIAKAEGVS